MRNITGKSQDLKKLLYTSDIEFDLFIDQVTEYTTMTRHITTKEVIVGIMIKSRYLIQLLPGRISPDTFIRAIPTSMGIGIFFLPMEPA